MTTQSTTAPDRTDPVPDRPALSDRLLLRLWQVLQARLFSPGDEHHRSGDGWCSTDVRLAELAGALELTPADTQRALARLVDELGDDPRARLSILPLPLRVGVAPFPAEPVWYRITYTLPAGEREEAA
jgi:hypothetical protein